jgi:hypothetical protein
MQWKTPKNSDKYLWTAHVSEKMHYYGLSEQKVLGVIRNPKRIETGIVENTVAVMLPVGSIKKGPVKPKWGRPVFGNAFNDDEISEEKKKEESWNQEIWVMYQIKNSKSQAVIVPSEEHFPKQGKEKDKNTIIENLKFKIKNHTKSKLCIISAWRYPGVSPKNNPIPEEILREISEII